MSDKLDNLKKTLQQKQPDSIEREQFRTLMRHIEEYQLGLGPKPTGRIYRAWSAAMMTKALLAKFSAASEPQTPGKCGNIPRSAGGMGKLPHACLTPDSVVPWGVIFAGAATASALSLLLRRIGK
jgi:hypothetical protein